MKCYMPGVPRANYMPFPFQIVQGSSSYILMAYEFTSSTRIIRMNWKQEAPTPSWMGWSRGRWEGDTLVVDVTGQRQETWFDRAGDYHSEDLHVVERYTPVSPYHLMYEATIEDPAVYTRPWKIASLFTAGWRRISNYWNLNASHLPSSYCTDHSANRMEVLDESLT